MDSRGGSQRQRDVCLGLGSLDDARGLQGGTAGMGRSGGWWLVCRRFTAAWYIRFFAGRRGTGAQHEQAAQSLSASPSALAGNSMSPRTASSACSCSTRVEWEGAGAQGRQR